MTPATAPRIAFFSDCFHEVNGVALTARQLQGFAARRGLPFFSLHAGPQDLIRQEGSLTVAELCVSRVSFPVESDMRFDMLAFQHRRGLREQLRKFQPDFIHITGPGHIGILGALLAHDLKIPLVASWHTNLHEFGARRLERLLSFLPAGAIRKSSQLVESTALACCMRFYRIARKLFAPNPDLVRMLKERTGKPTFPMGRGVDIDLFHPKRRTRADNHFVLGYVGRLSPEKNVRLLAAIERALHDAGVGPFRFLVVGQGSEEPWLRDNLRHAEFAGVLRGDALAEAYANMDLFVFPSHTDTFGNVIQEALSSGVPAIVTPEGGPKYLVRSGETGMVAASEKAFLRCVLEVMADRDLHAAMCTKARAYSCGNTWDHVFERLYAAYTA